MTEEEVIENSTSEEDTSPKVTEEEKITIRRPEAADNIEINSTPIDEWVRGIKFENTEDVPIPERLVDQVIGQDAGSIVIRKAAEQRRHMLMIGDPGGSDRTYIVEGRTLLYKIKLFKTKVCY